MRIRYIKKNMIMKRILTLLCLVGILVSCGTETKKEKLPVVIAHRGCWLDDVVP